MLPDTKSMDTEVYLIVLVVGAATAAGYSWEIFIYMKHLTYSDFSLKHD